MAILKHYQAHYTVAIAALFPLFVIWLDKLEKKFLLYLFLPFIFLAINYNFKARRNYNQQIVKNQQEAAMDEAEILKMPLDPGQKRYWMYRVVVPSFQRLFALDFAAARWLQNEVVKIQGEQWLTSPWQNMVWTADGLKAMSDTNWQYIVVANDTVEWVSTEMHPWLKDSRTKVLSLRQMKVFENPNFIESGSIQVKEISKDEH